MNLIEDLLKKYIKEKTAEVEVINSKIKELTFDKKTIQSVISQSISELQKICTHEKSTRIDGEYYPAGYDYYSESHYTIVCDNCKKVLESKCIRGTTFG